MNRPASRRPDDLAIAVAPAGFVLLWSTGFIGAKFGLPYAEPLTFLSLRFGIVVAMLGVFALAVRAEWPRGAAIGHNVVSGILLHGVYLSGVFIAIHRGMPAGIAALMVGLQPILTSTLASRWIGETVRPLQWAGLVLGLVGVYFVVEGRFGDGQSSWLAWGAVSVALCGVTVGTLYQKRHGGGDLRGAMPVQYAAALIFCGVGAVMFEAARCSMDRRIHLRAELAQPRALMGRNLPVLLAHPPDDGDGAREPVLSGATGDGADVLLPIRRAA